MKLLSIPKRQRLQHTLYDKYGYWFMPELKLFDVNKGVSVGYTGISTMYNLYLVLYVTGADAGLMRDVVTK